MLKKNFISIFCLFVLVSYSTRVYATDAEASETYKEGISEFNSGNYRTAAKKFIASELLADSYIYKANALKKAVDAYQKADMKYQEFLALKRLTEDFPDQIDFKVAINREYEIGNSFYQGYRETPWSFLPWIKDDDKCLEIYESILKQSPFANFVPEMILKMGTRYLANNKVDKAIDIYKKMILQYKNSKLTRFAYLDLANIYVQQAKVGDGDGSKARDARTMLQEFIDKYPNTPEIPWVKNELKKTYEMEAARLLSLAQYYNNLGNTDAAKRYIREILVNYPETKAVDKAYALLDDIEMPLYPKEREVAKEEPSKYAQVSMPQIERELLVIPQNSGRKWLVPITKTGIYEDILDSERYINKL